MLKINLLPKQSLNVFCDNNVCKFTSSTSITPSNPSKPSTPADVTPLSNIKIRNKGNLSLSQNSFQMRLGEIYTLWKYSRSTRFYLVSFPLFLTYCFLKYLLFHLRNIFL